MDVWRNWKIENGVCRRMQLLIDSRCAREILLMVALWLEESRKRSAQQTKNTFGTRGSYVKCTRSTITWNLKWFNALHSVSSVVSLIVRCVRHSAKCAVAANNVMYNLIMESTHYYTEGSPIHRRSIYRALVVWRARALACAYIPRIGAKIRYVHHIHIL